MSLKAVSIGKQANRRVVCLSTRQFTPREAYECHPALNPTTNWEPITAEALQPQRDFAARVKYEFSDVEKKKIDLAGSCYRDDYMYHHYNREIGWKRGRLVWSGYYGPYWTAHFGMHHFFLKRRLPTPGVYNKHPLANMWNRFLDNRGLDWGQQRWGEHGWGHGQGHHVVFKWILYIWFVKKFFEYKGILGNHFALAKPVEDVSKELPPYNSAFYQYILAGVENTPKSY